MKACSALMGARCISELSKIAVLPKIVPMLTDKSDAEIMAIAERLMDNLMQASDEIDFERHVCDFTPRLRSLVSEEGFVRACRDFQEHYGRYGERAPIAVLRRKGSVAVVWSQSCEKSSDQLVASLVIVKGPADTYLVDHALVY